jgi:uncharacterized protein (DUF302 family)
MSGEVMKATLRAVNSFALLFALFAFMNSALAADNGLINKQSRYSVKETIARFEAAVKAKGSPGWTVFTEIDHAAAAKNVGLKMRPRTVIVFGNPKFGSLLMMKTPTLAIDVPPKALVWEDDQGKVWLTYNSAEYLVNVIYARHGLHVPPSPRIAEALETFSDYATK